MINIDDEIKDLLNLSEEEFCKYLEPGTTKSLAWWLDLFNDNPENRETVSFKIVPQQSLLRKPPFKF